MMVDKTDLDEYSTFVSELASPVARSRGKEIEVLWAAAGVTAEAGEIAGVLEKSLRKTGKIDESVNDKLRLEIGDTMFFLMALANALDIPFDEIIEDNISKLLRRSVEGTLIER